LKFHLGIDNASGTMGEKSIMHDERTRKGNIWPQGIDIDIGTVEG